MFYIKFEAMDIGIVFVIDLMDVLLVEPQRQSIVQYVKLAAILI